MQKHIFNIHDVVLLMTLAECLLLVIFQAVLPVRNKLANHLLSVFLLCIGVSSACVLILWNDDVHTAAFFDIYLLPYFLMAAQVLKGPALLLYVSALIQNEFHLRLRHIAHLLPITLVFIALATLHITSADLRFINPEQTELGRQIANGFWHFIKLLPLLYALVAVYDIHHYRINLTHQYSDFSPTEPSWLNILSWGFLCNWIFALGVHIIANTVALGKPEISDSFGIAENYVILILINALFINSLVHAHQLLTTRPQEHKAKTDDKPTDSAIQKVHLGMEIEKLYLKQNLNIDEFSKRINLPVKDVSAVINKHYGTNFFEFMNSYRIEEAKRLLSDPRLKDMNIMDLLLQAGFNSKSAFHRFFNRLVGISPTEFRKQQLDSNK